MNYSKIPTERFHPPRSIRFLGLTLTDLTLIAVMIFGFVLRIQIFLQNRSLSLDESLLVLNFQDRSFLELLKPLEYSQAAPFGFILSQKAILTALGNRDIIFRLLPLLFGLAGLVLMLRVARMYNKTPGAWVAFGLFAVTFHLLVYSSEVKQYISDVFFTLLLLVVAPKCLGADKKPRDFILLLITSVVAIWFSHAIVFVLFGVFLALILDNVLSKNWRHLSWVVLIALIAVINFLLYYIVSLRFIANDPVMTTYWDFSFMPLPFWKDWNWFPKTFRAIIESPLGLQATLIVALIFWIGVVSIIYRDRRVALILIAPILAVMAASALHSYPFGERLILFLAPMFYLIIGEGVDRVFSLSERVHKALALVVWIAIVISLFYHPLKIVVDNWSQPITPIGIKPSISYLSQNYQGELIYIYYSADPAFRYYAPFYGLENSNQRVGISSRKKPRRYQEDLDELAKNQRVWFLFAHNCIWCKVNEENYYLDYLDRIGVRLDEAVFPGSSVYLYQLGKP